MDIEDYAGPNVGVDGFIKFFFFLGGVIVNFTSIFRFALLLSPVLSANWRLSIADSKFDHQMAPPHKRALCN